MKSDFPASVISNREIERGVFDMRLALEGSVAAALPGQFAMVYLPQADLLLPRPISLCGFNREIGEIRLVYKSVGKGTEFLSRMGAGERLRVLAPLGNGFPIDEAKLKFTLVGGGIGIPPMLALAEGILEKKPNADVDVYLGFRSAPFLIPDFARLGVNILIATDDGAIGFKGDTVQLLRKLRRPTDVIYACGPRAMLRGVHEYAKNAEVPCFVSMEERMGCGVGACVGCAVAVNDGDSFTYKKVCADGPVFDAEEVAWNE